MGHGVSLARKRTEGGETEKQILPGRGLLRVLGFDRTAVKLPHEGYGTYLVKN
jgi:hypothetical protein